MIRELEIIFGLDAVARELGVARHALVFLEQLGGIAALAIVLAVSRLSAEILTPLSPTTAPAAALSIVDQMPPSLAVVASPLGPQSGRAAHRIDPGAAPDPLVPVCAKAQDERPIASGVERDALSFSKGAGPAQSH